MSTESKKAERKQDLPMDYWLNMHTEARAWLKKQQQIRVKQRIIFHIGQSEKREREALQRANEGVIAIQSRRWHLA